MNFLPRNDFSHEADVMEMLEKYYHSLEFKETQYNSVNTTPSPCLKAAIIVVPGFWGTCDEGIANLL